MKISPQAKVGLFVLIAALLLAYMTIRVEDLDIEKSGYRIIAIFDAVSGLERAAQITVAGVPVGKVDKIELVNGKARVTMLFTPETIVRRDSEASIRSMGLLGEKYIEISPGAPDQPRLQDGDTLQHIKSSPDLEELASNLGSVAKDISAVSKSIRNVIGTEEGQDSMRRILKNTDSLADDLKSVVRENREQMKEAVENISRLSQNLDKLVMHNRTMIDKTVKDVSEIARELNEMIKANRAQMERTIANLERISQTLDQDAPRITKNANKTLEDVQNILQENRQELKNSLARMREASEKLDTTLASARNITGKIERGEGSLGKLITDEEAYNNLNEGLRGLKGFVEKGKDLQVFVGVRSEYMIKENESKTYISLQLQPRPDKYYLLEMVDDPRGKTDVTTTKRTTTPPGTVETVREEENTEKLKFSVQIAKKFYDFTLRGGLIESTGGLGIDYDPLGDDRIKFRLDAWDLGQDEPHIKFSTNFYVYERVFVNIGIDDIISSEHQTFFVGAGLFFNDQDLKALLGGLTLGANALTK
ncbi:MAG: MCE family protein [Candidatus Schekmanbacteria bacterium]|nr:MCE family protein [Candidatus Schekmanbacteria bacterium]